MIEIMIYAEKAMAHCWDSLDEHREWTHYRPWREGAIRFAEVENTTITHVRRTYVPQISHKFDRW